MLKASRFLNPRADIVFKKIFGQHAHLLKSFLNALMPLPAGTVIDHLEYLTPEQVPIIPEFKRTIVDVKCYDQLGRTFIIEMQMEWVMGFAARMLYGVSKAYVQQLKSGEAYQKLCPVYGLGLVNRDFDDGPEYFHHYKMTRVGDETRAIEGIEIVLVELMKFKPTSLDEKRLSVLWLRFLTEAQDLTAIPEDFKAYPEIVEAMELSQESAFSRTELEVYDTYWDSVRVEKTLIESSFEEGLEKGLEEGRQEGLEEGMEKGMEKGLEEGERRTTLALAKKLLASHMDPKLVASLTGLSPDDLPPSKG